MRLPAAPLQERPAADVLGALLGLGAPPPDDLFAALLNIQTAPTVPADGQTTATPDPTPAPAKHAGEDRPAPTTTAAPLADQLIAALGLPVAPKVRDETPTPAAPKAAASAPVVATADMPQQDAPKVEAPTAEAPKAEVPKAEAPAVPTPEPAAPKALAPKAGPKAAPAPHAAANVDAPAPRKTDAPAPKDTPRVDVPFQQAAPRPADAHPRAAQEPRPVLRAERVEALVRLATRHGAAEARMELHPQELGSVVVKLRVTNDGLQATFTASTPEAAAQLQQAGDDLRRSLEAKGLTLASLDVRAQSDTDHRRQQDGGQRRGARTRVAPAEEETLTTTFVPVGELVDVHA